MKRLILALALAAGLCFAQEHGKATKPGQGATVEEPVVEEEVSLDSWKWVNFVILAGGLGYFLGRKAGPFFAARSASISKEIEEAHRLRKEAEAKMAEADRKLAALDKKIAALRAEGGREFQRAAERISRQVEEDVAKVQAHSLHEIDRASKMAHAELKQYAAELAVQAAGQKIRARMTPAAQATLVDNFVSELK